MAPIMMQIEEEFDELLYHVKGKKLILEIGTALGGTLYRFMQVAADDAVLISIDLPNGIHGGEVGQPLEREMQSWKKPNQTLHIIRDSSCNPEVIKKVQEILNGQKFDFAFIDGDHTYEGILNDYLNYKDHVEGITAFHDILKHDSKHDIHNNVGVYKFWNELRGIKKEIIKDDNQGWAGIGLLFPPLNIKKLNLYDVTLVCVSDVRIPQSVYAVRTCMQYADFYDVKFFTSLDVPFEHIKIHPINNLNDYSYFVLAELPDHIHSKYCLIVQWDGFILNPKAWTEEYLKYDYIGATFSFDSRLVGNGGFSLRTINLMKYVQKKVYESNVRKLCDDSIICQSMRQELIGQGFKFAPVELANKFSIEGDWTGQFGFHSFEFTTNTYEAKGIEGQHPHKIGLHSGYCGDIVYALPLMKGLGLDILMIDYRKSKHGFEMGKDKYEAIKPLIESQGIKVIPYSNRYDIDYYLDAFRIHNTPLHVNHLSFTQAFPFGVDLDLSQRYIDLPEEDKAYDIVINRTSRYNGDIDYTRLLSGHDVVFVGKKEEYIGFIKEYDVAVKYIQTNSMLDVAKIINRAKVFIGNQSCCFALAEGLKANRILEVYQKEPNCMPQTSNGYGLFSNQQINYAKRLIDTWCGKSNLTLV